MTQSHKARCHELSGGNSSRQLVESSMWLVKCIMLYCAHSSRTHCFLARTFSVYRWRATCDWLNLLTCCMVHIHITYTCTAFWRELFPCIGGELLMIGWIYWHVVWCTYILHKHALLLEANFSACQCEWVWCIYTLLHTTYWLKVNVY